MQVSIHGAPRGAEFDLFVIQQPAKPFGVSWYQTDVNADRDGNGTATVRGIFDKETFTVSPEPAATIAPTRDATNVFMFDPLSRLHQVAQEVP